MAQPPSGAQNIPPPTTRPTVVSVAPNSVVTSTGNKQVTEPTSLEWLKATGAFVPLLQTLAWILLSIWLIARFKKELAAIVAAIKKRIEDGASVKAGPIELGELIRPQTSAEQAAKIEQEIEEIEGSSSSDESEDDYDNDVPSGSSSSSSSDSGSRWSSSSSSYGGDFPRGMHLLAEDLALRKIQEEYGLVSRQVTVGPDVGFDGVISKGDHLLGIEVKYITYSAPTSIFTDRIRQIHGRIRSIGIEKFQLLFVVVAEVDSPLIKRQMHSLREKLLDQQGSTIIRVFSLNELTNEFGVDIGE